MPSVASPAASGALAILELLFADIEPHDFAVRLWDGTEWRPEAGGKPAFTLVIEHASALRSMLTAGSEAALAEAYLNGDLSIEGDVFAVPAVARSLLAHHWSLTERARLAFDIWRLPDGEVDGGGPEDGPSGSRDAGSRQNGPREPRLKGRLHTRERDRIAVTHHYDLSNRFYSLFLDPRMVYSCAIFRHRDEPLESAQRRKLDLICRKLRLREGDRFLDIGCGWGALILHAASEYGADALGITLSERQAELARQRIREAGLEDRCRVEIRDYRTLDSAGFDRVASVGMFEHVGRHGAAEYFGTIHRLLRPGGAYLHHAITGDTPEAGTRASLSDRYVFPDHDLIPISETLAFAEDAGFDVRDVENLREHYALTLRHWVAALEDRHDEAVAAVGEATWRAWLLTFAGAAVDFEAGRTDLCQALMVRTLPDGNAELPLGRWDWYVDG